MTDLVAATSALVAATGQIVGTKAEMLAWSVGTAGGGPNGDGRYPFTAADNSTVLVPSPAALLQAGQSSRGIYGTTAKALSKGVTSGTITAAGSGGTTGTYALAFSGGAGSGAVGTFTVAAGKVISIQMMAPGDSYTSAPTLSFAACPGLTGATGVATIAVNVSVGQYFSVPVAGSNDALILYRVDAGPVATEVVRYPSSAVLPELAGRGSPFIAPPTPASGLWPLVSVRFFKKVGSVTLAIPAQITVRDFGRDSLHRFRLRLAGFDGASTYVEQVAESTSLNISVTGYTGVKYLPLYAVTGNTLGVAAGTVVGIARVDFGTGGTFGAYFANNIAWSVGGLYTDTLLPNDADINAANVAIGANLTVDYLQQRAGLFKVLPTETSAAAEQGLLNCLEITMLPAYALTGDVFVSECARDGINRFRFRLATWNSGTSTATEVGKESPGAGGNLSVVGYVGHVWVPIYAATGNPWGVATTTIVGYVRIKFGSGAAFGTYVTAVSFAVGAVHTDRIQMSDTQKAVINGMIEVALKAEAERDDGVFVNTVRNTYIRDLFQWLKVEGTARPEHDYLIGFVETKRYSTGPTAFDRIRFRIKDRISGAYVGEWGVVSALGTQLDVNALPPVIQFTNTGGAAFSGIYALARIDWTKLDLINGPTADTYTLMSEGGIRPENVLSNDRLDDFLDEIDGATVLRIGSGKDYSSVVAAITAQYIPGLSVIYNTYPNTNLWSFSRQLHLKVVDAGYSEKTGGIPMIPFMTIEGRDRDTLLWKAAGDADGPSARVLEFCFSGRLKNLTLRQDNPSDYCVHSDNFNGLSTAAAAGEAIQNFFIRQVCENVRFIAGPNNDGLLWGQGRSSGERNYFKDCEWIGENPNSGRACIYGHNAPGSTEPAIMWVEGNVFNSRMRAAVVMTTGFVNTVRNLVVFKNSIHVGMLSGTGCTIADSASDMPDLARDRVQEDYIGSHAYAHEFGDSKMLVLATTPGQAVTGTAATLLFGSYDQKHGRGEKLILEVSPYRKLGVRLGDCTSVNKTLTIAGQTHTFVNNYTGMTEASILAEVNAVLTTAPISVVRLDKYLVHDLGQKGMARNASGTTIAAKRFCNIRTVGGVDSLQLATAGDQPDCWTIEQQANGADDIVFMLNACEEFSANYIPELTAGGDGVYGIVNGVATPGATPPRISVLNGVAKLVN